MTLPRPIEPRDVRAWIALWASIGGAVALTGFAAGMVVILWIGGWSETTAVLRLGFLGKIALLALVGAMVVLISLGFAINRRAIKVQTPLGSVDASGGDDDAKAATLAAAGDALTSKAADIKEGSA